jgi:hypothetical protein
MASGDGYLAGVLATFGQAFQPLQAALSSPQAFAAFLANLGWSIDPSADISPVQSAFASVTAAIGQLSSDSSGSLDEATLAGGIASITSGVAALVSNTGAGMPAPLNNAAFWSGFPDDLLSYLVFCFLRDHAAPVYGILRFTGVLAEIAEPADATTGRSAFSRLSVDWSQLPQRITRIGDLFADVYGWGGQFEATTFIANSVALLTGLGASGGQQQPAASVLDLYYSASNPVRGQIQQLTANPPAIRLGDGPGAPVVKLALVLLPIPAAASPAGEPSGFVLFPVLTGDASVTLPLTANVAVAVSGEFQTSFVQAEIWPSKTAVTIAPVTADINAGIELSAQRTPPWIIAGDPLSTRLQIQQGHARISAQGPVSSAEFRIDAGIDAGTFVLDFSEGDGFLQDLLGAAPQQFAIGFAASWSSQTGLSLQGQPTLEAVLPVHQNIAGVLTVDTVYVTLASAADNSAASLTFSASGGLDIGPVSVRLERVGISILGQPATKQDPGNMGLLNFGFGFKAPDGAGLALQAPPVSGTGFLSYSATDGRYLGAVALMAGNVAISAVGVLDTRLPGGGPGYSLLILASATFPPVELGFGFSLSGLGGLVGVNRTADVPSLQALARAGRLDDLMFPADLLHRAPQVAANLAQEFPAAQGHFIVGPAVQLQWGTGGIIYADIGVFIELTDSGGGVTVLRIALVGLVHLTLPEAAAPVADITLDVLGVVDFAAQTLSLDAGLRNSTIATFPLTGQAALRAGWGSNPEFLFAIGGFNPHFQAPAGFPALQRIALSIGGDNPRLRLSAYLAVTSNTLQLGCAADLYAAVSVADVTAAVTASLTFDALVQFKPFGLIVDLTISAAILVNSSPVLSLSLDLHVTGPQPWTVTGSASFQFLFLSITVPISITAGPAPPPQSPQTADLDSNLITALGDPHSWATGPPAGRVLVHVVSQGTAQPAAHPLGLLTVRQHAVPLAQRIDRYGPDLLGDPCQYTITGTAVGSQAAASTAVTDFFAPAQFLTMTDAQKLSAPSFEKMTAGSAIGSTQLTVPASAGNVVDTWSTPEWDTLILDSPDPAPAPPAGAQPGLVTTTGQATVPDPVLAAQLGGASIAINGPLGTGQARYAATGSGIAVEQPTYAVVGMNLGAPGTAASITTLRIGSAAAGQAVAGTAQDTQVVYTSEVPG